MPEENSEQRSGGESKADCLSPPAPHFQKPRSDSRQHFPASRISWVAHWQPREESRTVTIRRLDTVQPGSDPTTLRLNKEVYRNKVPLASRKRCKSAAHGGSVHQFGRPPAHASLEAGNRLS